MSSDAVPLPREPDTLIEIIVELRDENGKLRAMLETLRRALYGARSERFGDAPGQLALGLEDVSTVALEPEPEAAKPRSQNGPTRRTPVRNIGGLPKHLPREDVVIEPASNHCPCCQGTLHRIGEDVSEMLDIVPAILRVKRIHRPRYGCRACESAVVQAPAPPRPVEGGLPTTALLAHVAAAKFAWHLPLHRQTQMLAGHGIDLDRSTLVHWIGRTAWWLQPLYALLTETVMAAAKVFCDDTPLPVLDRTRRRTRIARLWCYAVDDRPWQGPAPPAVVYRYAEDRRGRHMKEHLDGFHGVLQVDGYAGYDGLARPDRPGGAITLAYCLAHARREFFDVHKRTKDPVAAEALRRIGEVYAIEARIRGRTAEERVAVRQVEIRPLMVALWSWLMQRLEEISVKSSLAQAIRYTLGHWEGLTVFLADGRVEVDNNTVERGIRPIPLGRKNALFAGSHSGGERWAILASLINTAKLHGLDPQTYLADVLDRIVSGRTKVNALSELLPWHWKGSAGGAGGCSGVRKQQARRSGPAERAMSLDQLDAWLRTLKPPSRVDGGSMLDGYLTAIIIGPCSVPPDEWFVDLLGERGRIATAAGKALAAVTAIVARFNVISEGLSTAPKRHAPLFEKTDEGLVLPQPWCTGFLSATRLRFEQWRPLLDPGQIHHGLMLPILLYCRDPFGQPLLGPPREGPETEQFLRTAYHDIPLVIPEIRDYWMPHRLKEADRQA